jgi:hypothetical protein
MVRSRDVVLVAQLEVDNYGGDGMSRESDGGEQLAFVDGQRGERSGSVSE